MSNGLPNNTVYGIHADEAGRLWISTNHGLARFDPHSEEVRSFHRSHGLQEEEFNFGAHYASRSRRLFFGGANGYNAFEPARVVFDEVPPPVVMTSLLEFNKPVQLTPGRDAHSALPRRGHIRFRGATRQYLRIQAGSVRRVSASCSVHTTCSIGFACYPFVAEAPLSATWEEVLNLADMALYRAKARRDAWLGWSGLAKGARQTELFNLLAADPGAAVRGGYIDVRISRPMEGQTTATSNSASSSVGR